MSTLKRKNANGVWEYIQLTGQDISQLTSQLAQSTKKVNGFINIAEYGAIGDGITSDQTSIVNAITDALSKGYAINWGWDNKTYLTTDNIPNFHKVKHIGNAIIKRGSDLFYLSPTGTQRNKIYAATSGASNTFDGLSASQPVAKLQTAFDWITNYSPILTGYWEIVLSAGTFVNRASLKAGLLSENPIEISGVDVGGHPNVPTTILSEGVGAGAVGIFITDGSRMIVRNIKLTGFNGTSSSAGIKAANGSELTTSNVHTDSCYWGLSGENRSMLIVPDGIHSNHGTVNGGTGTGAAIRTLQLTRHGIGIQNNGNQTNTVLFKNCYTAMLAQESSTGHCDWATVQDCTYGLVTRVNARINCDGTSFKRNGVDLRAEANAHIYVSGNVVFAPAGVDESANKIMTGGGGSISSVDVIVGLEMQYSTTDKVIDRALKNQTIATTTATNFYTATLKTPLWRNTPTSTSPMKKLFVRIFGVLNGTTGTKTINFKLGGIVLPIAFTATDTGPFTAEGYIFMTAQTAQTLFFRGNAGSTAKVSRTTNTLVLTSNVDVALEALVANTSDSVVIDVVEFGYTG
jgi:hypothetical protein